MPYRLVTNETQLSRDLLFEHLSHIGFEIPSADYIVSPSPLLAEYLIKEGLRPMLLVHDRVSIAITEIRHIFMHSNLL